MTIWMIIAAVLGVLGAVYYHVTNARAQRERDKKLVEETRKHVLGSVVASVVKQLGKQNADQAAAGETIEVSLTQTVVPPRFPCPSCGKESKEDHEVGWRVCSKRTCRHRFQQES